MVKNLFLVSMILLLHGCGNREDGSLRLTENAGVAVYDQIRTGESYDALVERLGPVMCVITNENGTITCDHLFDPTLAFSGTGTFTNGVVLTVEGDRIVFKAPIIIMRQ